MPRDRHGRARRADRDRRHRPSDGFRTTTPTRFATLVADALAALPATLAAEVDDAEVLVEDVPVDPDPEEIPLARFVPADRGEPALLVVYRRPVELRAFGRADLVDLLRLVIGRAVADALGLEFDDDED